MADEITVEKLKVELEADINQLKKDLNSAKSQFTGFEKDIDTSSKSMSSSLGGLGKAAAAAFAIKEVSQFAMECIDLASDLQEVQNVVDVTFGDMADQVNDFAKNAMESFGLSETAAKQYAGTMGAMLQSSGLSQDMALEMSTTLTSLSADLASFYNLSNEDAFAKVRSGMSGETEPLKALGINLSVANMEAYALSQGITKSYDAMTQAEQAVLRYNYLIATTAAQQGDFARTSDSWANQTKVLSMRFDELKSSIGNGLIVVLNPVLELVNGLVSGLSSVVNVIGDLIGLGGNEEGGSIDTSSYVNQLEQPVQVVSKDLGTASKNAKGVADGIKKATTNAKQLKATLSGFDEANVLSSQASGSNAGNGALNDLVSKVGEFNSALNSAYGEVDALVGKIDEVGESSSVFGDVSLSMSQIKDIAKQIIGEENLKRMAELTNEVNTLDEFRNNVISAKETLDSYDWMIKMGFEVSESDYKAAVDNYLKATQDYVEQQHKVVKMGVEYYFGEGSIEAEEIDSFYTGIESELADLSKQIKQKVNEAWANDGLIDIDEQAAILELNEKRDNIIRALNEAESEAELTTVKIKFGEGFLDKDSFNKLVSELNQSMQVEFDNNAENFKLSLTGINTKFKLDPQYTKEDWDRDYKNLIAQYNKMSASISNKYVVENLSLIAHIDFSDIDFNGITNDLSSRLDEAFKSLEWSNDQTLWLNWFGNIKDDYRSALTSAFDGLDDDTKEMVRTTLDSLKPTKEQYEETLAYCKKYGLAVPQGVSEGLTAIKMLEAMTGDVDAIWYLIGQQVKGTPFEDAVNRFVESGGELPNGIYEGMLTNKVDFYGGVNTVFSRLVSFVKKNNELEKTGEQKGKSATNSISTGISNKSMLQKVGTSITNVVNSIQKKASKIELSDEGKKALSTLNSGLTNRTWLQKVYTSADSLEKKVIAGCKPSLFNNGKLSTQSFATGLLNKTMLGKVGSSVIQVASKATKTAVSALDVKNGKSGKFDGYGKNTVEGFNSGISTSSSSTKSPVSSWANSIMKTFKDILGIKSPSRVFGGYGLNTIDGYDNSIEDNMEKSRRTMQTWGNNIARWGGDYVQQDLNVGVGTRFSGNITSDITGNLESALIGAMSSQQNTFFAEINIGGEKHVVQFVKKYNQMHASNPNLAFNL